MRSIANKWFIQTQIEASQRPPETISESDFKDLYRQRRVAMYQERGGITANPDYFLIPLKEKPADAAEYLCNAFAVSHDDIDNAAYTISLVGSPMQKIVIVRDHP